MEKSNFKKIVIIILFILVLLILLIINYFINFNVEENIIDENKDKLFITITDEETYQIFENIIDEYNLSVISSFEKNIDDFNMIDMNEKILMGFEKAKKDTIDPISNGVLVSDIEEYFKNNFKSTIYWDKEDIYCYTCGEYIYLFDVTQNKYVYNEKHLGHGLSFIDNYYTKITDIKKRNETYVVTMVNLWHYSSDVNDIITTAYSSYSDALNNKNELFKIDLNNANDQIDMGIYDKVINEFENNFSKYENKMHKYIYTFEKQNNKYLLVSMKYE